MLRAKTKARFMKTTAERKRRQKIQHYLDNLLKGRKARGTKVHFSGKLNLNLIVGGLQQ